MSKIALFDLDGTLADYEGAIRRDLMPLTHPEEGDVENLWSAGRWIEARMSLIKRQPGWWRELPVIESGLWVLHQALEIGYQCQVLTKGPEKTTPAWSEKVEWCRANLPPEVKVTITEDKSGTYGAVFMDDWPKYILPWLKHRHRGLVIMPDRQCNQNTSHPQVLRYRENRDEVVHWLLQAYRRKHGEPAEI